MNALTYDLRAGSAKSPAAPAEKPAKGFFARILDAMIEARMREARRQIRIHIRHLPEDVLKRAGYTATYRGADELPFVK